MISILEEDILLTERIFLPNGESFSEEKKEILKCLQSKDIVACPGSGKTTTLLAKLSILEKKLPLPENKGICVLTHTNVAIDEIKERLGDKSNKLFEYPNFFGTIQSFVNRFLAIPYFQNQYNKKVNIIDDDVYNREIVREFTNLSFNIKSGLNKKYMNVDILLDFLKNIRFDLYEDNLVSKKTGEKIYKAKNSTSQALMAMKQEVMKKGILSYDDAYWLAYKYVLKYEEHIKEIFSERFPIMFIDEMQDTSNLQNVLLNTIFDKSKVIVQRFGDPNQSIYENGDMAWDLGDDPLKITDSKRNSIVISKMIAPFEIINSSMKGNESIQSIPPKIIVFKEEDVEKVLPKFAQLILDNQLHISSPNIFKAIGRISKKNEKGKLTNSSYFPLYNQKKKADIPLQYLSDFLSRNNVSYLRHNDVKSYRDNILNALLKALWLLKIKRDEDSYFTVSNFLKKLQTENSSTFLRLEEKIFDWCLKTRKGEEVKDDFIEFTKDLLNEVFDVKDISRLNKFFTESNAESAREDNNGNYFVYRIDEKSNLEIEVNTVAGVKGETHTATLFLETFFYNYDIKLLIDSFKGISKSKRGVRETTAAKLAYVAMSRPTHLLCVAARDSSIAGHEEELHAAGWELVNISEKSMNLS